MTNSMEHPSRCGTRRLAAFALFALLSLCLPGAASAQWTTPNAQGNINTTNNGNVGVGTQTPHFKLDVRSAAPKTDPAQHVVFTAGSSEADTPFLFSVQWFGSPVLSGRRIELQTTERNVADGGNLILQPRAGNVGIGTHTPAARLDVIQPNDVAIRALSGSLTAHTSIQIGRAQLEGTLGIAASAGQYALDASGGDVVLRTHATDKKLLFANGPNLSSLAVASTGVGVTGDMNVTGAITGGTINAKYQDVAEWVPSTQKLPAGTVVVLDPGRSNHVLASTAAYDTAVAGVISARPGLTLGEAGEGKALVATTGRVKVRVDATRGAIKVGDLLVTSNTPGVAMRSQPLDLGGVPIHRPGTLIGKALEPLEKGTGEILVLLSLQ